MANRRNGRRDTFAQRADLLTTQLMEEFDQRQVSPLGLIVLAVGSATEDGKQVPVVAARMDCIQLPGLTRDMFEKIATISLRQVANEIENGRAHFKKETADGTPIEEDDDETED